MGKSSSRLCQSVSGGILMDLLHLRSPPHPPRVYSVVNSNDLFDCPSTASSAPLSFKQMPPPVQAQDVPPPLHALLSDFDVVGRMELLQGCSNHFYSYLSHEVCLIHRLHTLATLFLEKAMFSTPCPRRSLGDHRLRPIFQQMVLRYLI